MSKAYPVNEIFYSLQGEGYHAGQAATFIRFSGCNLQCPFCDTDHTHREMLSATEIVDRIKDHPARLVVLTGGEPSLFIDEELIEALHAAGKYITVETNGARDLPSSIDWITFSPKIGMAEGGERIELTRADEIKVVNVGQPLDDYFCLPQRADSTRMYLQPCFVENEADRLSIIADTIKKIKADPRWILSAQLHRFLHIP